MALKLLVGDESLWFPVSVDVLRETQLSMEATREDNVL